MSSVHRLWKGLVLGAFALELPACIVVGAPSESGSGRDRPSVTGSASDSDLGTSTQSSAPGESGQTSSSGEQGSTSTSSSAQSSSVEQGPSGEETTSTTSDSSDASIPVIEEQRSALKRIEADALPDAHVSTLAKGQVDLSFDLLRRLNRNNENLAVSAWSLSNAFGMVHAMAKGQTQKEIAAALAFNHEDPKTIYEGLSYIDQALESRVLAKSEAQGPVELASANRLFFRKGMQPGKTFLDQMALYFDTGVSTVDFANRSEQALKEINGWVASRTKDKIPELLSSEAINGQTQWVVVNALYMSAPWAFDMQGPVPGNFTTLDDETLSVQMLIKSSLRTEHGQDQDLQWAFIPLRGQALSLMVILPKVGAFEQTRERLNADLVQTMKRSATLRTLELAMPQFKVDAPRMNLIPALGDLGLKQALSSQADFRGHSDGAANTSPISFVAHQVYLSADKYGIEGAAASGVGSSRGGPERDVVKLTLDRPFFFAVIDTPTGVPLFAGQVTRP